MRASKSAAIGGSSYQGNDACGQADVGATKPTNVACPFAQHKTGADRPDPPAPPRIQVPPSSYRPTREAGPRVPRQKTRGVRERMLLAWPHLSARQAPCYQPRVLGCEDLGQQEARPACAQEFADPRLARYCSLGMPNEGYDKP